MNDSMRRVLEDAIERYGDARVLYAMMESPEGQVSGRRHVDAAWDAVMDLLTRIQDDHERIVTEVMVDYADS